MQGRYNILFLCTGNSARSIMAEAIMNKKNFPNFKAFSAGSYSKGEVHPVALGQIEPAKLPTDDFRSKSWNELASPDAPKMDFVFTVCDQAAKEVCPLWPGQPMTANWGVPDPAETEGTPQPVEKAFPDAFMILDRRISLFLCLEASTNLKSKSRSIRSVAHDSGASLGRRIRRHRVPCCNGRRLWNAGRPSFQWQGRFGALGEQYRHRCRARRSDPRVSSDLWCPSEPCREFRIRLLTPLSRLRGASAIPSQVSDPRSSLTL
jgi:arsenate reductase (thioredoxin)